MVATGQGQAKKPRKERAQLSCTFCRHRKLKCDRNKPCQNCVKRSQESSCRYATQAGRIEKNQSADDSGLQNRIQHLEDLVVGLMSNQGPTGMVQKQLTKDPSSTPGVWSGGADPATQPEAEALRAFGRMNVDGPDSSYVGNEHWTAILDDIAEVKKHIASEEDLADSPPEVTPHNIDGPDLLLGVARSKSPEDYMEALPSKNEVDRIVSRYLNSHDPLVAVVHVPSFQSVYERFWQAPEEASLSWMALMYSMMSQSSYQQLLGLENPSEEQSSILMEDANVYRQMAAQCLIASNYIKPGRWTLEALMVYLFTEMVRTTETKMGLWIVLGVLIRLSMRMGYHRDSDHFPQVSVFHGEMRRRVWTMVTQLDLLSSVQLGLPRMIRQEQTDARLPSNYLDSDLSENMTKLPKPRPDHEFTPLSYHIFKGRLTRIVGKITDEASATFPSPYERIVKLDAELMSAFEAMPAQLQAKNLISSVVDSNGVIMKRINLALLCHKGICILHRRYISLAKTDERYVYSLTQSMASAKTILRHQLTIFDETQPGGRLYPERWLVSSLTTEDFTLAAMVICLNLDMFWQSEGRAAAYQGQFDDKSELLYLIEKSYEIWNIWRSQAGLASYKATKASQVLGVMLRKIKSMAVTGERKQPQVASLSATPTVEPSLTPFTAPTSTSLETPLDGTNLDTSHDPMAVQYDDPELMPIMDWIDMPQDINWQEWDDIFVPNDVEQLSVNMWAPGPGSTNSLSNENGGS